MRSKLLIAHLLSLPRGSSSGPARPTGAGKAKGKHQAKPGRFNHLNGGTDKTPDAPKGKAIDAAKAQKIMAAADKEMAQRMLAAAEKARGR